MINKPVAQKLGHAFVHDVKFSFLCRSKFFFNVRKRVN